MAMLLKFIKEWSGHKPGSYGYESETQADFLIKRGVAESAEGREPRRPLLEGVPFSEGF